MEKKEGLLFLSLFLIVISIFLISAATCYVTPRSACLEAENNDIVVGFSALSNAHTEAKSIDDENTCQGTATACGDLISPTACGTQEGCSWDSDSNIATLALPLTGNPVSDIFGGGSCIDDPGVIACGAYDNNQPGCENQKGCGYEVEYGYVLCCDFDHELSNNECTRPNKGAYIMELSSDTNAHAESTTGGLYNVDVCSQKMGQIEGAAPNCLVGATNPEPDFFSAVLSFTGVTNAHVGTPDLYDQKLWCTVNYDDSIIPEFYCGDGVIKNPNSQGVAEECEPEDLGCTTECSCDEAQDWAYDELTGTCIEIGAAAGEPYWAPPLDENNPVTGGVDWDSELTEGARVFSVGETTYWLTVQGTGYSNGQEVEFNIFDDDPLFDDLIKTLTGTANSSGDVAAYWTVTQTDVEATTDSGFINEGDANGFYFTFEQADGETSAKTTNLNLYLLETIPCETITMCMDYMTPDRCSNDALYCNVGAYSVSLNYPEVDCSVAGTCSCFYEEATAECGPFWNAVDEYGRAIGSCATNEDASDNCDDNFLTYSWESTWSWDADNTFEPDEQQKCRNNKGGDCINPDGDWHYDPQNKYLDCAGGQNVVPCPARIQLNFFNIYNLAGTVIIIAFIYLILNSSTIKRKKSKKRKK